MTNQQLRQKHFYEECRRQTRRALEAGEVLDTRTIACRAAKTPAPFYYLEYDYALRRLGEIARYDSNGSDGAAATCKGRRAMWAELAGRVKEQMDEMPELTFGRALTRVLAEGGASCYFFSDSYAHRLYHKMRNHERRHPNRLRRRHLF